MVAGVFGQGCFGEGGFGGRANHLEDILPFGFKTALADQVTEGAGERKPRAVMAEERRLGVATGILIGMNAGQFAQLAGHLGPVEEEVFFRDCLAGGNGFKSGFTKGPRHVAKTIADGRVGDAGDLLEFNTRGDATKLARARLDGGNDLLLGLGHKTPQGKAFKKVRYLRGPEKTIQEKRPSQTVKAEELKSGPRRRFMRVRFWGNTSEL
jgi:hypothetical protein